MATSCCILVVDDEEDLCNILQKVLTKEGYRVLTATSSREVLPILKREPVDLALLDLKMPGLGGLDLLKKIRGLGGKATSLPVIILTAHGSLQSAREAMERGAVDYLTKPFDLDEVKRAVREALRKGGRCEPVTDQRQLVYVPILHTLSDMGTLAGSMHKNYVKKYGRKKWVEHVRGIEEMWEGIRKKIVGMNLPIKKTRIYQDGLPLCGKELAIVTDLAQRGSLNHRLVLWLMDQGASLVGTEDPDLLVREYSHLKKIVGAKRHEERERLIHEYDREAADLLKKRDQAIRNRILSTLKTGETGILFMGLLHRVDELMPPSVKVSYLIHRLPFKRSFELEMVA